MALGADQPGVADGAAALDHALRSQLERRGYDDILDRLSISHVIPVQPLDEAQAIEPAESLVKHSEGIADGCRRLASRIGRSVRDGQLTLVLGGDHSLSIGTLAGASRLGRLGVIWIDAHGALCTPETAPGRHANRMALAVSLGYGPPELVSVGNRFDLALDDLVHIGVRRLDRGERQWLRQTPSMVQTMTSIDLIGIPGVVAETARRLTERGVDSVHISFDVDVLDPAIAPGTGSTAVGGLSFREAHLLLSLLRASDLPVVSVDFVELNPELDHSGQSTSVVAALVGAMLGEEIL